MGDNFTTPSRDDRIYAEAAALWRQIFDEPPPSPANGAALLEMIMRSLPDEGYDRLRTPHLRPANITWPAARVARG